MYGLVWLTEDNRRTAMPVGWEPLRGHRSNDGWTWRMMTKKRVTIDDNMSGVTTGSINMGVYDDTRWKGSLEWEGLSGDRPAWDKILVQPVYSTTLDDGSRVEWAMGVYLCHTPGLTHLGDDRIKNSVRLHDLTLVLRRAKLLKDSGVFAGTPVVNHVRSLVDFHGMGQLTHAIADSDATLPSTLTWPAGTSILTIVNELLTAIGYESLNTDMQGVLRSSTYVRPGDRPEIWSFNAQNASIHKPGSELTRDDFDTVNRVKLLTNGGEGSPPLSALATLDDLAPGHPLSAAVLGQFIDDVETVEASSQQVLQAMADRRILEAVGIASTQRIEHRPVPIGPHARVSSELIGSGTVQSMDIECAANSNWSTVLREVVE